MSSPGKYHLDAVPRRNRRSTSSALRSTVPVPADSTRPTPGRHDCTGRAGGASCIPPQSDDHHAGALAAPGVGSASSRTHATWATAPHDGPTLQEFLPMWAVMMTAMMLPAVAPVASLYARTIKSTRAQRCRCSSPGTSLHGPRQASLPTRSCARRPGERDTPTSRCDRSPSSPSSRPAHTN